MGAACVQPRNRIGSGLAPLLPKAIIMIESLALLLVCQLTGETLVRLAAVPLPGPVVGMALLFGWLLWRGRRGEKQAPAALGAVADAILKNLSLLFVPAAVGVIQHGALIWRNGIAILLTLIVSTVLTLSVTALVFARLSARVGAR